MMEDTKTGMGWGGILLIFVVIWILFGAFNGGGFGWNNNRCGNGCGNGCENTVDTLALIAAMNGGNNGCNRVSNCEVERQELIDSAQTRYLIEQQGAATRTAVVEGVNSVQEQNNRIYIQGIQAELFDAKAKINQLESQAYTKAQTDALASQLASCCCQFNRRIDSIEAQMLTKPNLFGVASTCAGQVIPSSSCNCGNI